MSEENEEQGDNKRTLTDLAKAEGYEPKEFLTSLLFELALFGVSLYDKGEIEKDKPMGQIYELKDGLSLSVGVSVHDTKTTEKLERRIITL